MWVKHYENRTTRSAMHGMYVRTTCILQMLNDICPPSYKASLSLCSTIERKTMRRTEHLEKTFLGVTAFLSPATPPPCLPPNLWARDPQGVRKRQHESAGTSYPILSEPVSGDSIDGRDMPSARHAQDNMTHSQGLSRSKIAIILITAPPSILSFSPLQGNMSGHIGSSPRKLTPMRRVGQKTRERKEPVGQLPRCPISFIPQKKRSPHFSSALFT